MFFVAEMAPKRKVVSKKQKCAEGTSRGPINFDEHRFLGIMKEVRFRELSSTWIWSERRFDIHPEGCFRNCTNIITDRS